MIKTLQNTLKQDKEHLSVPKSVQDTIPIRRLWPDGLFQFGGKFSKTIRFSDINYAIASKEDKTSMFLGYSELLNALDTGSTTKITINNKRLNRRNFEREILIPPQGDHLDGGRSEYNAMLLDKVTDSSNSMVQERYVTVSAHKKTPEEARTFFDRVMNDVTTRLNHLDSHCEELDAVERLRVLHDFYRVGEESRFHIDLRECMKTGRSFKDTICPDSMEFRKDHFIMGDKYGRAMFLKEYASYIKDSMINELTSLNRTMMLSIDVIPVPTDEAVREMQNRLLGVETNVTNWQRRQNSNNNFSAVVPYDLEQQRKETREMLDDLTTRDQRMMFAVVTLVHLADSKEELDSDTETLQSIARKHLCQLTTLNWQQDAGLVTALPLGLRRIDALRTLTTEALAVLMPFKAQEIRDRGGIYYGQNVISKNLIIADRKQLLNGNGFVLGVSGSGKSFTAKREITALALSTQDDILIIDPESEYRPLVEGLGGEVVEISATSSNHINAMDMEQGYGEGENPVVLKSEFLLSLCEQSVGAGKLSAKEKSIIDRCTAQCYHDYVRDGCRGQAPTLQDFHAELLRQPEAEARDVALALELFTEGSLNTFAKPTNVDMSSRIACYDIRKLGKQLLSMGMLVILDSFLNRITRNRRLGRNTWIYIDEIYLLFQHEYSANFLFTLWKRVRKYGACCTGLTQNVDDLLQSHTARTMLANSEFLVMLNQASTDRLELARLLNISDNQLSYANQDVWVYIYGDGTYEWIAQGVLYSSSYHMDGAQLCLDAWDLSFTLDGEGNLIDSDGELLFQSELPDFYYEWDDEEDYSPTVTAEDFYGCWEYTDTYTWVYIYGDGTYEWYDSEGLEVMGNYYMFGDELCLEDSGMSFTLDGSGGLVDAFGDTGNVHLKCSACRNAFVVGKEELLAQTARQLAAHETPVCKPYAPSAEAVRLANAINRALEQPGDGKEALSHILQGAAARYACCDDGVDTAVSQTQPDQIDWERFERTVSHIIIGTDNAITVHF